MLLFLYGDIVVSRLYCPFVIVYIVSSLKYSVKETPAILNLSIAMNGPPSTPIIGKVDLPPCMFLCDGHAQESHNIGVVLHPPH